MRRPGWPGRTTRATGRASSRPFPGSMRRSCGASPRARRCGSSRARGRARCWRSPRSPSIACSSCASPPTASGRAIPGLSSSARTARRRSRTSASMPGQSIPITSAMRAFQGALLAAEECLLDPKVQVRNPGFTRGDYEKVFASTLGITRTIWLGRGIAGDDTHGHIDDIARFVSARAIVLCEEKNAQDPNHAPLRENKERLQGTGFELIALPMPQAVIFNGQRLPASYANFYICNAAVLVPVFAAPKDRIALGILSELFNDREVVGIPARDLVWGLGTLHCLSQQEPRQPRPPEAG